MKIFQRIWLNRTKVQSVFTKHEIQINNKASVTTAMRIKTDGCIWIPSHYHILSGTIKVG
jgi:urease beta subunit